MHALKEGSKGNEYFKCISVWGGHRETNRVGCCGKPPWLMTSFVLEAGELPYKGMVASLTRNSMSVKER